METGAAKMTDRQDEPMYHCPVCGAELIDDETVYLDEFGRVLGCEWCVKAVRVWQIEKE